MCVKHLIPWCTDVTYYKHLFNFLKTKSLQKIDLKQFLIAKKKKIKVN